MSDTKVNFDEDEDLKRRFEFTWQSQDYIVKPADGGTTEEYMKMLTATSVQQEDGTWRAGPESFKIKPYLVHRCTFKQNGKAENERVGERIVKGWPDKIVQRAFEEAKQISGLDLTAENEDAAKNELSGTDTGSD